MHSTRTTEVAGGGGFWTLGVGLLAILAALVWAGAASGSGCAAARPVPDDRLQEAYIEFRIEPKSAEIYIDGDYRGRVEGWVEGLVPVEPGTHRLKVTAEGYITRRFDVEVGPGKSKILELEMEPKLETFPEDTGSELPRAGPGGASPSLRPRRDVGRRWR